MGAKKNACRILMGKPEGKRPLESPRRRWVDFREIGWDGMNWIDLSQSKKSRPTSGKIFEFVP
jgi:hypothetical protein